MKTGSAGLLALICVLWLIQAAAAPLDEINDLRLRGEYAQATELALAELEIVGEDAQLLNLLGELEFDRGNSGPATAYFQRALELDGLDRLMAQLNLARVHLKHGRWSLAQPLLDAIRGAYQNGFGLDARDLYAIATALRLLGKTDPDLYREAVRIYDEAIRRDPSRLDAGIALGELLLEKYNNQEAQQAFRQVLDNNDEHPRALLGLARSQHFDYSSEAVTTTLQALSLNPKLVSARVLLARLLIELEQYDDARHEIALALEVNPESVAALSMLAAVHHLEREPRQFDAVEQRVRQINPRSAEFYTTLAELAAQNRLYADAARFAAIAVELDPQSWRAHGLLGINQLRLGRMQAGRASLELSFSGDPFNVWIKNTLQLADRFGEFVEYRQDPFVLVMHRDESALLGEYLPALADEAWAYFKSRYRHQPDAPIRIELYPEHADFSVRSVGLAGVGLLGVCFGPVVAMDSPAARARGSFNWASTLWHEIAHVFHLSLTDNRVPRWFSEGLAVYEEQRARPGWGADADPEFLRAYLQGRLLPVSRLNNGFVRPAYPEQVVFSYYQASLVFEFIEARWGFDVILEILRGFRDSADPDALLQQKLALDFEQLDAEFDRYFEARFATALASLGSGQEDLPALDPEQPPQTTEVPESYAAQMRFGQLLLEQGNLELAELFLQKAQQLFPQYAGADSSYWQLAQLYRQQNRLERAEQQLAAMVAINAEHYQAQRQLAELRARRGDFEGAADALEAAIFIYPYEPELHRQLAGHAERLADWERLTRARRAQLALDPVDRAEAHYQLAAAYLGAGDRSSAREQILYALEIAPNYYRAQELLLSLRAAAQ